MDNGALLRKILTPHIYDISAEELKVFVTLFWFADPESGELSLSLFSISRKINIRAKEIAVHLQKLKERELIGFTAGNNPWLESHIRICYNSAKQEDKNSEENIEKLESVAVSTKNVNVSTNDQRSFKKNVKNDNESFSGKTDRPLTAVYIAKQLNDLKNLRAYEVAFMRYPVEVIERAYLDAYKVPEEKVKRSRGAIFSFLLKKYAS